MNGASRSITHLLQTEETLRFPGRGVPTRHGDVMAQRGGKAPRGEDARHGRVSHGAGGTFGTPGTWRCGMCKAAMPMKLGQRQLVCCSEAIYLPSSKSDTLREACIYILQRSRLHELHLRNLSQKSMYHTGDPIPFSCAVPFRATPPHPFVATPWRSLWMNWPCRSWCDCSWAASTHPAPASTRAWTWTYLDINQTRRGRGEMMK